MRLGFHRSLCRWCGRYEKQLELLGKASRRLSERLEGLGAPKLNEDARARLRKALRG